MLSEREDQLAYLRKLLETSSQEPGRGQVAVITGAVGSGKTELLDTFAREAVGNGAVFLSATATRAEQAVPLGVLGQLFRGAELPPERVDQVTRLLKEGVASGAFDMTTDGAGQASAYILHGLCVALQDMVEHSDRPLLIGIDDVHVADEASVRCIAAFTRRIRSARVLVVLTESVQPHSSRIRLRAELPRQPQSSFLRLDPLSVPGVEAVLAHHLDERTAQRLAGDYHSLSGGNPVLLRGLVDDYRGSEHTRSPRLSTAAAFGEALLSCLYRCESSMLETARGMAVLGKAATPSLLAALADIDTDSTLRAVGALNATGVLAADWFRHPGAAQTVLDAMGPRERARMHAKAAHLLYKEGASATAIADQLVAADDADVAKAVALLHEATEQALADDEPETALRYLRAARQRGTDARDRAVTTALLMRAEGRTNPAVALRRLPEVIEAVRSGHLAGRDLMVSAGGLLWFGKAEITLETLRQVGGSFESLDLETRGQMQAARMWLTCVLPASVAGTREVAAATAALPAADTEGSQRWVAGQTVSTLLAGAAVVGASSEAAEHVLQQCRLDEHTVAPIQAAVATLICEGRLALAESWCGPLLSESRRAPAWYAMFSALRAEIALRRGDLADAERYARTALTVLRPQSWGLGVALPLSTLLNATTALGKLDEAAAVLQEPLPDAVFRTQLGLVYLQARGRHHHAIGQYQAAVADFRTVGNLVERWGADLPGLLTWRTDAAQSLLRLGENEQAEALAREQIARCGSEDERLRAISTRVLAAVAEPEKRPALLREAVEGLQTYDDRLELAHTLCDLGLTHKELGHHGQARMILRNAHHLAKQCGAETAGRTLPPQDQGTDGQPGDSAPDAEEPWTVKLSNAEYRVAVLAASNYSNRQIARKLFITVSTVEQHLTRVYRKLNVTKRTDLVLNPHHAGSALVAASEV